MTSGGEAGLTQFDTSPVLRSVVEADGVPPPALTTLARSICSESLFGRSEASEPKCLRHWTHPAAASVQGAFNLPPSTYVDTTCRPKHYSFTAGALDLSADLQMRHRRCFYLVLVLGTNVASLLYCVLIKTNVIMCIR